MNEENMPPKSNPAPEIQPGTAHPSPTLPIRKKRKVWRWILIIFVALLVLLGLLYGLVTSSFFLTGVVLPQASKYTGIEMAAAEINLSLWHQQVECKDFRLGSAAAPTVKTSRIFLRADLHNLKSPTVKELTVDDLSVQLSRDAGGQWSLPVMNAPAQPGKQKKTEKSSSALPDKLPVNVEKLAINRASIAFLSDSPSNRIRLNISELQLLLEQLTGTNPTPKLTLSAKIQLSTPALQVEQGSINLLVNTKLHGIMPTEGDINLTLDQLTGKLNGKDIKDNRLQLIAAGGSDGNQFDLKECRLEQYRSDHLEAAAEVKASGTVAPLAVDFSISAAPVPPLVIGMIEPYLGGFKPGRVAFLSQGKVSFHDQVLVTKMETSLKNNKEHYGNRTLPSFEAELNHDLTVDLNQHLINARQLQFRFYDYEQKRPLVSVNLTAPFNYNWTASLNDAEYPSLELVVDRFNLDRIRLFMPDSTLPLPHGVFTGKVAVSGDRSDNSIVLNGNYRISNLSVKLPQFKCDHLDIAASNKAKLKNLNLLELAALKVLIREQGKSVLSLNLDGSFNLQERSADFNLKLNNLGHETLAMLQRGGIQLGIAPKLSIAQGRYTTVFSTSAHLEQRSSTLLIKKLLFELDRNPGGRLKLENEADLNLCWKNSDLLGGPVNLRVLFDNFDLTFLNILIPHNQLYFYSAKLGGGLSAVYQPGRKQLDAKGDLNLEQLAIKTPSLGERRINDLRLQQQFDLSMLQFSKLNLHSAHTILETAEGQALNVGVNGSLDTAGGAFDLSVAVADLNQRILKVAMQYPPDAVRSFTLSGNLEASRAAADAPPAVKADVSISKLVSPQVAHPLDCKLKVDIVPEGRRLVINQCMAEILDQQSVVTNLTVNGAVALPLNQGKTQVNIGTQALDLKLLETLLKPSRPATAAANTTTAGQADAGKTAGTAEIQPEPRAVELGADAEIHLALEGITYGPQLRMACRNTLITVKDNKITAAPLLLYLNNTPITVKGYIDLGKDDGYPYQGTCSFTDLELKPIFLTFLPDQQNLSTQIKTFDVNLAGCGFRSYNLEKHLSGTAKMTTANMVFPYGLNRVPYFNVLLIPIDALARLNEYIPQLSSKKELAQSATQARAGIDVMKFADGKAALNIANGYVNITEFELSNGDFLKKQSIGGTIPLNPDNKMQVNSKSVLPADVVIPLYIEGTPRTPKPDYTKMVEAVIKDNFTNILDKGQEVKSLLNNTGTKASSLLNNVLSGSSSGSSGSSSGSGSGAGKAVEVLKSLF